MQPLCIRHPLLRHSSLRVQPLMPAVWPIPAVATQHAVHAKSVQSSLRGGPLPGPQSLLLCACTVTQPARARVRVQALASPPFPPRPPFARPIHAQNGDQGTAGVLNCRVLRGEGPAEKKSSGRLRRGRWPPQQVPIWACPVLSHLQVCALLACCLAVARADSGSDSGLTEEENAELNDFARRLLSDRRLLSGDGLMWRKGIVSIERVLGCTGEAAGGGAGSAVQCGARMRPQGQVQWAQTQAG